MSLKLLLNFIISALLLIIMVIGAWFLLSNARDDVRAEIESTANLAAHLLDTQILSFAEVPIGGPNAMPFRLKSLNHVRHLRIEFYDVSGTLLDSNATKTEDEEVRSTPRWFVNLMDGMSVPWEQTQRSVLFGGRLIGHLVITPDPSYEVAEVWSDMRDILGLTMVFFIIVNALVYWAVARALKPIESILVALEYLERGKLDTRLPAFKLPELALISTKFNQMAGMFQQTIKHNLLLSKQLISLQETERKSLARDLHDEIGQSITAIHIYAQTILSAESSSSRRMLSIKDSANAIASVAQKMMGITHQILERLRPDTLDKLGLEVALEELISSWRSRLEHVSFTVDVTDDISDFSEIVSITIYRVVQECLTNIARYAEAEKVSINILRQDAFIDILVEDNGRGFDLSTGYGLEGMRERVEGLGGFFEINSTIGEGTRIFAKLPLSLRGDD